MSYFWTSFFCTGFIVATLVYFIARKVGLMAIVDTIWTAGLGLSALFYYVLADLETVRSWVVLMTILLWSLRLSCHLFKDRVFAGREDPRYEMLAARWGGRAPLKFFFLFLAQIVFIAIFLWPVTIAMEAPGLWRWTDTLALAIAVIAVLGETTADRQLAAFRSDPRNKGGVCKEGLWRYSRHPNYFFEWLYWFAYVAFAIGSEVAWLAWLGPVAMFIFLRFLTGVPYAERSSLKSRGEAYCRYQSTTNAFFPWIPRKQPE
jgi:steroid 5-alpha reductase family enzyme